MTVRHFLLQRLTAVILAPLILGHLILIIYATRKGLSAADILSRTRGSITWALYYGTFVLAAAVHGAIGLRGVLREWGPSLIARSDRRLDGLMWVTGATLAALGLRAVYAVIAGQ
jgi:fumarate reductase subunit C